MIFSSFQFILVFLPVTLLIFHLFRFFISGKFALGFLSLSSCFFYAYWNPKYLVLLVVSILGNYFFLKTIEKEKKKIFLTLGLFFNLTILIYFKYRYFILENVSYIYNHDIPILKLIIPLGISFFTFQQISLLIDTYQKKTKCKSFLEFIFFVSFFPQLIAGPIVLFDEVKKEIKQLISNKKFNLSNLNIGFSIFTIGLFKKIAIADTIAIFVDKGYSVSNNLTFIESWLLTVGYFFQIYFDFSGYSDMAIGLGLLFGFVLPLNFNNPYNATSMIDYWKRWHITMTRFFMTYIYYPSVFWITGKFNEIFGKSYLFLSVATSIFITFFLSGIWHGANWKFVIFGLINALGLVINHYWVQKELPFNKFLGWFLTMLTVLISLIFFRAENIQNALLIIKTMFSFNQTLLPQFLYKYSSLLGMEAAYLNFLSTGTYAINFILILCLSILLTFLLPNYANKLKKINFSWKFSIFISSLFLIALGLLERPQSFIYFEF
jgi:alginate O-acetyltransferase complex protein AlgI